LDAHRQSEIAQSHTIAKDGKVNKESFPGLIADSRQPWTVCDTDLPLCSLEPLATVCWWRTGFEPEYDLVLVPSGTPTLVMLPSEETIQIYLGSAYLTISGIDEERNPEP